MSSTGTLRKDFKQVIDEWKALDPTIRLLDLISLLSILLFGVGVFALLSFEVPLNVTNVVLMLYPVFIAGYTYSFRSKLNDPKEDKSKARKEYLLFVILVTLFIPISLLYSFALSNAA